MQLEITYDMPNQTNYRRIKQQHKVSIKNLKTTKCRSSPNVVDTTSESSERAETRSDGGKRGFATVVCLVYQLQSGYSSS